MKVQYSAEEKENFVFAHGDVREEFTPGEEKEVSQYVGEELLKQTRTEKTWEKETGKVKSEKAVALFSEVPSPKSEDQSPKSKDQSPKSKDQIKEGK